MLVVGVVIDAPENAADFDKGLDLLSDILRVVGKPSLGQGRVELNDEESVGAFLE